MLQSEETWSRLVGTKYGEWAMRRAQLLSGFPSLMGLVADKRRQIARYHGGTAEFVERYRRIKPHPCPDGFVDPAWMELNVRFEKLFLPKPPLAFMRNSLFNTVLSQSRGGIAFRRQLSLLEKRFSVSRLAELVEEDAIGIPLIFDARYKTSHNSVHHLYGLTRFVDATGVALDSIRSVVEWGGGYGNMGKLMHRVAAGCIDYTIIDSPLMSCFQWLYLSSIIGPDQVNLLDSPDAVPQPGKINLLPLPFLTSIPLGRPDLFLSTWALSESPVRALDFVLSRDWFGAKHLLLSFVSCATHFDGSRRIREVAMREECKIEELGVFEGSCYAFR